jgi:signal transduction histidine kinase/CHASE2 domain-containing sensor protein
LARPSIGSASRRSLIFGILAVALVALRYGDPGLLHVLRLQAFDVLQRSFNSASAPGPVTVIDIDEQSIAAQGQWPWPRSDIATLVDRLADAGFGCVVLDMVLPEAERGSQPGDDGPRPGDTMLAKAMGRVPVVLGFSARGTADGGNMTAPPLSARPAMLATPASMLVLPAYGGMTRNLPAFEAAAAGIGHLHVTAERDGIVRRLPIAISVDGRLEPALAFEAVRITGGGKSYVLEDAPLAGDLRASMGDSLVPLDREGGLWVAWNSVRAIPRISATSILDGTWSAGDVRGGMAVVGVSAAGIADRWATPVGVVPGVLLQAQVIDNLFAGRPAMRPSAARWAELGFAVLLCVAAALTRQPAPAGMFLVLGAGGSAVAISAATFAWSGVLVDPTFPVLASIAVAAVMLAEERNQARSAELVASTRLVQAVESVPLGFLLFDEHDRLLLANRRAAEIAGVDRSALRFGLRRRDIVTAFGDAAQDRTAARGETGEPASAADSVTYEVETPRGDHLLAIEKHLPHGGTALLYTDIAQIKERERQLEALRDKAEESNRLKSQFLANVSHELRTPLNAIIGFSEILEQQMFGPIGNDRYRGYAADILDSGRYLLSIVQDLLDLSAFEAGRFAAEPKERIDVKAVVESVQRLVADQAAQASIHLAAELPERDVAIFGNQRLLRQILVNLVSNALKFTPADGTVSIVVAEQEGGGLALSVRDDGAGMAPEVVELATRPFWRGNDPFLRNHAGTGLGLALVKSFAAAQGASLHIESAPGEGTCVVVAFPAPAVATADRPPPAGVETLAVPAASATREAPPRIVSVR